MNIEERVAHLEDAVETIKMQLGEIKKGNNGNSIRLTDERLGLSRRALNVLARVDCETVEDAIGFGLKNFHNVYGCGMGTAKEICYAVENANDIINGNQ